MSGGEFVLSGEDREQLVDWWDSDWTDEANGAIGSLITAVEAIVQRAVNAALNDAADGIDGWREMATWAASHTEDPDSAQNSAIRAFAYQRAVRIVRANTT